jgi:hypothetical protein
MEELSDLLCNVKATWDLGGKLLEPTGKQGDDIRRLRNRASAGQSRQRKKCYVDELAVRNVKLEADNAELRELVKTLLVNNTGLRDRLSVVGQIVEQPAPLHVPLPLLPPVSKPPAKRQRRTLIEGPK